MAILGVVLAAGQGKRLRPLTLVRSKPMLPVLGKPLVEWVLEMLYGAGVERFIVVANPADSGLIDYIRRCSAFRGYTCLAFQEKPLGMADALRCARPLIEGDFILAACDSLVRPEHVQQLLKVQCQPDVKAVLSLQPVPKEEFNHLGAVVIEGGWVRRIVEKPGPQAAPSSIASLPLYVLPHSILAYLDEIPLSARGEYELQDAIQMLIEREGGVRGVLTDWRMDVTTPQDLLELNLYLMQQGYGERRPSPDQVGGGTVIFPPVRVEEGVRIGVGCCIGPCVYLEEGAEVGDGATVRWAMVLRGSKVEEGEDIAGELRYPPIEPPTYSHQPITSASPGSGKASYEPSGR